MCLNMSSRAGFGRGTEIKACSYSVDEPARAKHVNSHMSIGDIDVPEQQPMRWQARPPVASRSKAKCARISIPVGHEVSASRSISQSQAYMGGQLLRSRKTLTGCIESSGRSSQDSATRGHHGCPQFPSKKRQARLSM